MGIISDLKAIIDLLHKRDESNKLKLDTEIARHELAERQRLIQQVQLEDVHKYDPNTARLLTNVGDQYHPEPRVPADRAAPSRAPMLAVAALLALIAVILVLVWLL
jgi:hypothetical protein